MKRRPILGAGLFGLAVVGTPSLAQVTRPFVLRVVRQQGWAELMKQEDCLSGTLYVVDAERILTDRPGRKVAYVMELPDRSNQKDISAVPAGTYEAFARLSEKNGAVIELKNVPKRTVVQFHSGNEISHTDGCFILGTIPVASKLVDLPSAVASRNKKCWIGESKAARKALLAEYGWTDLNAQPPSRPIAVIVE